MTGLLPHDLWLLLLMHLHPLTLWNLEMRRQNQFVVKVFDRATARRFQEVHEFANNNDHTIVHELKCVRYRPTAVDNSIQNVRTVTKVWSINGIKTKK